MQRRTFVNLVAVIVASLALISYATAQLVAGVFLDNRYPLYVELPRAGGLVADKEVTYNGHGIGQVADMEVVGEVARLRLAVEPNFRIPTDVDVVVQRSSALGEQVLDFRPRAAVGEGTDFYEAGDTVAYRELTLPPEVQRLFALANDVFEPIDKDAAGMVVAELADAVRGRSSELRSIMRDSADFSETLADNSEDFDRFFASGRVVNRVLAENRDTLAELFGDIADATTILTDMRTEFEGVLADAPPTLALAGDLVERAQPNLSCTIRDLATLNAYVAQPEVLNQAGEALRLNRWFFDAFHTFTQEDEFGKFWQRIRLAAGEHPGERYEPKRPIPDVLPGGACSSPFGEGAPAATQPGFVPVTTETRVVRPEHDRTEPVRRPVRSDAVGAPGGGPDGGVDGAPLPVTGAWPGQGAALPLVLGLGVMAAVGRLLLPAARSNGTDRGGTRG